MEQGTDINATRVDKVYSAVLDGMALRMRYQ